MSVHDGPRTVKDSAHFQNTTQRRRDRRSTRPAREGARGSTRGPNSSTSTKASILERISVEIDKARRSSSKHTMAEPIPTERRTTEIITSKRSEIDIAMSNTPLAPAIRAAARDQVARESSSSATSAKTESTADARKASSAREASSAIRHSMVSGRARSRNSSRRTLEGNRANLRVKPEVCPDESLPTRTKCVRASTYVDKEMSPLSVRKTAEAKG
jgi:hypothetical protein